jgi:hypothetical protein
MKTIVLPIGRIITARKALNQLMQFSGIDRKKVYWLTRNNDALDAAINEWYMKIAPAVFDKYSIDIPADPFIPANQYHKFKEELINIISVFDADEVYPVEEMKITYLSLNDLFKKYEKSSDADRGIPIENQKEYKKEITELALKHEKEIKYTEIVADPKLDNVLANLTGEEIKAIEYMLEEPSVINVFQGGTIQ